MQENALFFIQVYHGLKSCTFLLENFSLHVPPASGNSQCSVLCAYAADMVGKDLDIFALGAVSLDYIYTPNY
jgi:hypothetical protein